MKFTHLKNHRRNAKYIAVIGLVAMGMTLPGHWGTLFSLVSIAYSLYLII